MVQDEAVEVDREQNTVLETILRMMKAINRKQMKSCKPRMPHSDFLMSNQGMTVTKATRE